MAEPSQPGGLSTQPSDLEPTGAAEPVRDASDASLLTSADCDARAERGALDLSRGSR